MTDVIEHADVLSASKIEKTIAYIESVQVASGLIPWFEGGHGDPWNHVEAAMALASGCRLDATARAFVWLRQTQRDDGSWHAYYECDGSVKDDRVDTNATGYVATGLYHFFRATESVDLVSDYFSMVERAIEYVLDQQLPNGAIAWSINADGSSSDDALLSASASIYQSLCAAIELAAVLRLERQHWSHAAFNLRLCIQGGSGFVEKDEYAMDWYYPILSGAIDRQQAAERLDAALAGFLVDDFGILCRSDRRWVTTAETAEFVMALHRIGRVEEARALFATLDAMREPDGTYPTGLVLPNLNEFPRGERTTYSCAAVILANDVLAGGVAGKTFGILNTKNGGISSSGAQRR